MLLLACANVANLGLAQTAARQRELAVRSALGAARRRLVVAQLAESLVLAITATALALVFVHFAWRWTMAALIAAEDAPAYWIDFSISWRLVALALLVALLTSLAAGLAPALRAADTP